MTNKKSVSILIIILIFLLLFSCDHKPGSTGGNKDKQKLPETVDKLEVDVLNLRMSLDDLTNGSTAVSCEEKTYSIAQTKLGAFLVVCKNVTQYLDGYKVNLDIGNLTSARLRGAKLHLYWGKSANHNKEIDVTNTFLPGRYTTIEVVMTPAKPEDTKEFLTRVQFDEVILYK